MGIGISAILPSARIPSFGKGIIALGGMIEWNIYWSQQDEVLFFAETKNIADGKLYNQVVDSTDYLTVSGSSGSETFQCPDTAAYIAADTDYIWFKTDETPRNTTTAELYTYDLQRTPVKFDDESPYALRAILILKAGATLSAEKRDFLFRDFWLPILWDANINSYGHIKENRIGQNLWVPEPLYDDITVAWLAAMVTPPDETHSEYYDTFIKAWRAAGFWPRTEWMLIPAINNAANAMIWVNNPTKVATIGSGTFTAYTGYAGNDLDTGRIVTGWQGEDAAVIAADSFSLIHYCRTNSQKSAAEFLMVTDGTRGAINVIMRNTSDQTRTQLMDDAQSTLAPTTDSTGCFIYVRDGLSKIRYRNGGSAISGSRANTGISTGQILYLSRTNRQNSFYAMTDKLSAAEVATATNIINALMTSLGINTF